MNIKKSYSEKLLDPRWQKKRLEILNRDEFTCRRCGNKDKTLHVHHGYYETGLDPWEYLESSLLTLCEFCHKEEQACMQKTSKSLTRLFTADGYQSVEIDSAIDSLDCIKCDSGVPLIAALEIIQHDRDILDLIYYKHYGKPINSI